MTEQHPITPPPDLLKEWIDAWYGAKVKHENMTEFVATQAARWGADQELEWCVSYVDNNFSGNKARALRAARRPKPPSLKEQALNALAEADGADYPVVCTTLTADQHALIRRALEALPDAD